MVLLLLLPVATNQPVPNLEGVTLTTSTTQRPTRRTLPCGGCGKPCKGTRGLRAHQNSRTAAEKCKPQPTPAAAAAGLTRPAGFATKWDTECHRCPDLIRAGDQAVRTGSGKLIHPTCASGADDR